MFEFCETFLWDQCRSLSAVTPLGRSGYYYHLWRKCFVLPGESVFPSPWMFKRCAASLRRGIMWPCPYGTIRNWWAGEVKAIFNVFKASSLGRNRNVSGVLPADLFTVSPCTGLNSQSDRLTFIFLSNSDTCSSFRVTHRGNMSKMALVSLKQTGSLFTAQQNKV